MAAKKDKQKVDPEKVLGNFTYEEIPGGEEEIELTQEMIDNSVIIDLGEIKTEEPIEEKPKEAKSSVVEFELPPIKEPEKSREQEKRVIKDQLKDLFYTPKKNRRNKTRKIEFTKREINIDEVEIPDTPAINYIKHSEVVRDWLIQLVVLEILRTLKDLDSVNDISVVNYLKDSIPHFMASTIPSVLNQFPWLEEIKGESQVIQKKRFDGQEVIAVIIDQRLIYHHHMKTYSAIDVIEIPI